RRGRPAPPCGISTRSYALLAQVNRRGHRLRQPLPRNREERLLRRLVARLDADGEVVPPDEAPVRLEVPGIDVLVEVAEYVEVDILVRLVLLRDGLVDRD